MATKNPFPFLISATLCVFVSFTAAAGEPSVTLARPGAGVREIKVGDNVPDQYQRASLALNDWRKRHLSAPGEHEQWVEIEDKYVLVSIPTGTITKMITKSDAKR